MATEKPLSTDFDVIVIGAGISGINTGYRLQTECPDLSYTILEGRENLGGTWDLFKYPGIRSDSDLHTFGFNWEHWAKPNPIADADSIKDYLNHCVKKYHIDEKIQFQRQVERLDWKSSEQRWTINVKHNGEADTYHARYIIMGTGYYDYAEPLEAKIPGIKDFEGETIHPQFWPEDLDYAGKKIIVIGSGATAITLLPNLANKAEHVTQVQRSPGFYIALPQSSPVDAFLKSWLPINMARSMIRFKFLIFSVLFYQFCRRFPNASRKMLQKGVAKELPSDVAIDPHFQPVYNPWDQRMCVTPAGDYFVPFREGKASVVTGQIQTVTKDGLIMESGEKIDADMIITATGLKIRVGGGIKVFVDGQALDIPSKFMWKGAMLQDLPNLFYVIGYANASWTLAADTTAFLATRIINNMKSKGLKSAAPRLTQKEAEQMDKDNVPLLPLTSTYVTTAMNKRIMPRAGKEGNWKPKSNYFRDIYEAKYGNVTNGLEFR